MKNQHFLSEWRHRIEPLAAHNTPHQEMAPRENATTFVDIQERRARGGDQWEGSLSLAGGRGRALIG